ncbi:hypothetical protein ES707_03646 [subsurface metagenome]
MPRWAKIILLAALVFLWGYVIVWLLLIALA